MDNNELGTNLASLGTDAISRQQAIDAVMECYDNDELFEVYEWKLNELPPIQPDIVRCKDCKYWDTTWQNDYAPNYHYCPMIDGTHRNDFYCAGQRGER